MVDYAQQLCFFNLLIKNVLKRLHVRQFLEAKLKRQSF